MADVVLEEHYNKMNAHNIAMVFAPNMTQDISYSIPFCSSEVEQISREDLVELSEIEKQNLGQAKRMSSMPDVDSSPKSLLAVNGNQNVHGLYDCLLNYRSLLTMLSNMDVPVLRGPLPFLNATLSHQRSRATVE